MAGRVGCSWQWNRVLIGILPPIWVYRWELVYYNCPDLRCKCLPPHETASGLPNLGTVKITACDFCTHGGGTACAWQTTWVGPDAMDWVKVADNCACGCNKPISATGNLNSIFYTECLACSPPQAPPLPPPPQPTPPVSWPVGPPPTPPGAVIAKMEFTITGSPCDCLGACWESLSSCCDCCGGGGSGPGGNCDNRTCQNRYDQYICTETGGWYKGTDNCIQGCWSLRPTHSCNKIGEIFWSACQCEKPRNFQAQGGIRAYWKRPGIIGIRNENFKNDASPRMQVKPELRAQTQVRQEALKTNRPRRIF